MSKTTTAAALALGAGALTWLVHRSRAVAKSDPTLRHRFNYRVFPANNPAVLWYYTNIVHKPTEPIEGVGVGFVTTPTASSTDNHEVDLYTFEPTGVELSDGIAVWIHGGGLIMGSTELDIESCSKLAHDLGTTVVSVDYRLAPEHPYPAAIDDCVAAIRWAYEEAKAGKFNPDKIVVIGASAGGGLAAAAVQRAHDEGIPVAFQALIYPMLDATTGQRPTPGRGEFSWTPSANRYGWRSYLGALPRPRDGRPYAVPAEREDLSGLPPAWIGVGDLDLFFDEDLEYARRLREAGVEVELVAVPGMYHAADGLAPDAPKMRTFRASMISALREVLHS
ncbi:hypothetical protein BSZ39_00785 [Bowdeniella nasicola]|uniref:Alpha/beta hydrolase fold-3 domain-containing protein n=1 Tax=Bowdeniella nasicola TaxID=208480 RepID=A0A1Q5Q5N4_9ACTO|nr:alpha/beta hydrolase [Bowdeniella nasicola]OKL55101.1 hypothetical protein BSZ39_00785 [Bowdeniella nasicola]